MIRLLTKNEQGNIILMDADGTDVVFFDSAECLKYTGVDFSDKYVVTYEPLRNRHAEFDGLETITLSAPYAPYDDMLDNIQNYIDAKEDPGWGMTAPDAEVARRDRLVVVRMDELTREYYRRLAAADGDPTPSRKERENNWYMKALRREAAGTATQQQLDFITEREAVSDSFDLLKVNGDAIRSYINNVNRTSVELQALDVTDPTHWD